MRLAPGLYSMPEPDEGGLSGLPDLLAVKRPIGREGAERMGGEIENYNNAAPRGLETIHI